jgi:thioredoxin 1
MAVLKCMNNNTQRGGALVPVLIVLVILIGGGIYWVNRGSNAMVAKEKIEQQAMVEQKTVEEKAMMEKKTMEEKNTADSMMKKDEGAMAPKGDVMMKAGTYEVYASEKVALASATHDVVLFFRAGWCPTCRAVDADIKANLAKIPASLAILDVNYDNSTALKQKYGVTYQHTFVQVDKDGTLIKKWSGSPTLAAVVAEVK